MSELPPALNGARRSVRRSRTDPARPLLRSAAAHTAVLSVARCNLLQALIGHLNERLHIRFDDRTEFCLQLLVDIDDGVGEFFLAGNNLGRFGKNSMHRERRTLLEHRLDIGEAVRNELFAELCRLGRYLCHFRSDKTADFGKKRFDAHALCLQLIGCAMAAEQQRRVCCAEPRGKWGRADGTAPSEACRVPLEVWPEGKAADSTTRQATDRAVQDVVVSRRRARCFRSVRWRIPSCVPFTSSVTREISSASATAFMPRPLQNRIALRTANSAVSSRSGSSSAFAAA